MMIKQNGPEIKFGLQREWSSKRNVFKENGPEIKFGLQKEWSSKRMVFNKNGGHSDDLQSAPPRCLFRGGPSPTPAIKKPSDACKLNN